MIINLLMGVLSSNLRFFLVIAQSLSLMVRSNDVQRIQEALPLSWFKNYVLYLGLRFGIFTRG